MRMASSTYPIGASESRVRVVEWLFNPFKYVAGARSLVIGLAAILVAGFVGSLSNSHFDGVLDFHTGRADATWVFLLEGVLDWLCLAIVLFILGKLASKTAFRVIDLFGTQSMARWPSLIIAAAALAPPYRGCVERLAVIAQDPASLDNGLGVPVADVVVFGFVVLVAILAVVWMVALMYQSYSVCCNIKGARAIGTFIVGLLAAELAAKLAVVQILMR